ncbi:MAG: DUF4169 family protein [Pseudomonadota bacterium]
MGDVVNFSKYRKQRELAMRRARAAENRVRHGRPASERSKTTSERNRTEKDHDGKRLEAFQLPGQKHETD